MPSSKRTAEWPLNVVADNWSGWVSFNEALAVAPRLPGVYVARQSDTGPIVYIGMAGERTGGGRPQGIRGRLAVYTTGKGLASGLGEAAFDRALADPEWVAARLSYRTPEVVVVQPRAGGSAIAGLRPLGSLAGMNVSLYVFDLDAADLLAEEQRFVDAVRARS